MSFDAIGCFQLQDPALLELIAASGPGNINGACPGSHGTNAVCPGDPIVPGYANFACGDPTNVYCPQADVNVACG